MPYSPRILGAHLSELLGALPAVAVDGPRGVGKTATASRLAACVIRLDDEAQLQVLRQDPSRISRRPVPLLIDEWQVLPTIWDHVRRAVDDDFSPGRFLLTGSATPSSTPKHSGAGRIVHVRMRPFTLVERACGVPSVSLADLLSGSAGPLQGSTDIGIDTYAEEISAGGLPALRRVARPFRHMAWEGYFSEILDRELPELGVTVRRRDALRAWLRAYAAATATTTSYTSILDAATPNDSDKPSKATTIAWRELLHRMWLLDALPAWDDPLHCVGRLGRAAKHHLADPAMAAHLLGVTPQTLLEQANPDGPVVPRHGTLFGALFESLVTLSVRVYAQVAGATTSHLRTRDGDHEVDLIVGRSDGKALAIEVKSTPTVDADDVRHLKWLQRLLGPNLIDAIVITTGPAAYRRSEDGIAVIPAALLGP